MTYLANAPSLGHISCLMLHHWRIWKRIISFCSWFLRMNLINIFFRTSWFFFFKELEILKKKFERIGNLDWIFFFFESELRSTSPTPIVLILFFSLFFFNWKSFFFLDLKICSLSKSEEDEDEDGTKVMKIYSWWFFLKKKPILWMRITLAGSWCGLLDKSLLNSYKKIISISNGFIHWNELEVLTQCP